jgi:Holliday junction resolvase-like predicted endonuclease
MSNYTAGHLAEKRAADYLKVQGFKILELNWKTRYCEIDIVVEKGSVVYFVEVKYRQTDKQGYGLDYITPRKLKQMQFAAEVWVQTRHWQGGYQLAAVGIDAEYVTFVDTIVT